MNDLMKLLEGRRTYRRFEQREIDDEIISEMLEAARLASSAANRQPLSYVVIKNPRMVAEVFACTRWAGYLPPEQGQPQEGERPVLFVGVIENTDISANCDTDAGLAISNMTLAAWNRGVGSCIIGACDREKLSLLLELDKTRKLHSVVAFGYPSHASRVEEMKNPEEFRYYLDDNRDYVVPKRRLEDVVRRI